MLSIPKLFLWCIQRLKKLVSDTSETWHFRLWWQAVFKGQFGQTFPVDMLNEVGGLGETLLFTRTKSDKNWPRSGVSNMQISLVLKKKTIFLQDSLPQHDSWVTQQWRRPSENENVHWWKCGEMNASFVKGGAQEALLLGTWHRPLKLF